MYKRQALLILLVLSSEFITKFLNSKYKKCLYLKLRNFFVRGILNSGKKMCIRDRPNVAPDEMEKIALTKKQIESVTTDKIVISMKKGDE